MPDIQLTLIGKPGCHLCDDARDAISRVTQTLPDASRVTVEERSILDEPELFDRYAEEIPVVLIDGRQHTYWRVDTDRLAAALNAALAADG
ncbi:glutaredoxin family protein [Humibacter sp. RRB41]|uniref:glutaredoxin family protein n=1 Tax=Humibacter sp. RRB41 TaxID=2919946 RepID=UPI001FAA9417|nr:glutaredoxin family protein [Humibacter sp. RRB41]